MTAEWGECPRRQFLCLVLAVAPLAVDPAACQGTQRMPDWMMSQDGSRDPDLARDEPVIHDLLSHHRDIMRAVVDLSYGIRATTTSARPDVAARIRAHVEQMKARLERGAPLREKDPLFAELFEFSQRIDLQVEYLPQGVRVSETSRDPLTVMLIRQHAHRAVSEFVAGGMNRAVHPTPLPPGYHR